MIHISLLVVSLQLSLPLAQIYTGPSGRFRPHVDTPRSVSQFGSLVVCLPLPHQGGQLAVRHHGQQVVSDWSWDGLARPSIKWAAFYSDCEHEVLEVTSGHRVTLTYNLYVVRGAGRLAGSCPALQPASLPLFSMLGEMLRNAIFMEKGQSFSVSLPGVEHLLADETVLNFQ